MKTIRTLSVAALLVSVSIASTAQANREANAERQLKGLTERLSAMENRFRVNGFATFGITQSDEEVAYNGIDNETNFRRNSKAGIQFTFNLDAKTSVVTQMVSRGSEDWKTETSWAYVKRQFTPEWSAKVGRIRGPYYMLSEYLDVGYAVPWTTMPQETYSLLDIFSNADGANVTWDTEVAGMGSQLQLMAGRVTTEQYLLEDLLSVGYALSGDTWSVRLAHSQANIALIGDPTTDAAVISSTNFKDDSVINGTFDAVGFRWEPGDLLVMGEYTVGQAPGVVQDETSMFLSAGYRIGQWMPHLTYATVETTDDEDRSRDKIAEENGLVNEAGLLQAVQAGSTAAASLVAISDGASASNNSDTQRIGVGVRYDWSPGVAVKLQYDMITVNDDQPGLFDPNGFVDISGGTYAANPDAPDSTNIITFTIDTVF